MEATLVGVAPVGAAPVGAAPAAIVTLLLSLVLLPLPAMAADPPALAATDCVPTGALRGDQGRGQVLHREHCADCHGLDGRAEVIVMHMDVPPRDQTDAAYMGTLSDGFLYLAVCRGGDAVGRHFIMPAWGQVLSDQDIKDLVAFMRSFSGT